MAMRVFEEFTGLSPFQIIPRDRNDHGRVELKGSCAQAGSVQAKVFSGKRVLQPWREIARARGGGKSWSGALSGLPVGGPYTVAHRLVSASGADLGGHLIKHVLVGDLWILAGQSNMHGVGDLDARLEKPHRQVSSYSMREVWEKADEPLHSVLESPDSCHWNCAPEDRSRLIEEACRTRLKGAGLGLAFAKALVRHTGVPIGLIPCAHGGTSMQQWSPDLKRKGGRSLYGSMLRRAAAAGGRIKGVLWYQGEAECRPESAPLFAERFTRLVRSIRDDLDSPELPFLYVQIARFPHVKAQSAWWDRIREAQRLCEDLIPRTAMVTAVDLPLDDAIHISTDGLIRLGKRLGDAAGREAYGLNHLKSGPRIRAARFVNKQRTRLKLTYDGVHGTLLSPRRVGGFSACDAAGKPIFLIFDSFVDPDDSFSVILKLEPEPPLGTALYYGAGADSLCTLIDSRDHAAPAFGPLALDGLPWSAKSSHRPNVRQGKADQNRRILRLGV